MALGVGDGPDCSVYDYACGFFGTQSADTLNFIGILELGANTYGSSWFVGDSAYFLYYYNYRNLTMTYNLTGLRK